MVMALGLNHTEAGMFHLTTHAFFKALLFLGAGSLIHAFHTQDIWKMKTKSLIKKMPITSITFMVGTLALMGIPPLSGFFSKEEILTAAAHGPEPLFWMAMFVVFLTAFYMGRLTAAVFLSGHMATENLKEVHEPNWRMWTPLIILAIFSVIGGYLPIRNFIGHHGGAEETMHGSFLLITSLSLAVLGFAAALFIYREPVEHYPKSSPKSFKDSVLSSSSPLSMTRYILVKKFFLDDFYDFLILKIQDNLARLADIFERWIVVEGAVNATARFTRKCGDLLRRFQTGAIQFYVLLFTGGVTILIYCLILGGKS